MFNQSTAQLYDFLEKDDPALFAAIKEKVADGQWEPIGAMWVEPDTNMPTGESFVRQLLYGQRYFEQDLRQAGSRVCWLPDCFGFSPALPQILRLAGRRQLLHHQGELVRDQRHAPSTSSGGRASTAAGCSPTPSTTRSAATTARSAPRAIVETWRNFRGKHLNPESLLAFG